jgi:hypothetical protein
MFLIAHSLIHASAFSIFYLVSILYLQAYASKDVLSLAFVPFNLRKVAKAYRSLP